MKITKRISLLMEIENDSSMLTIYMEAMNLNSSINASFLSLALDEDRNNVS